MEVEGRFEDFAKEANFSGSEVLLGKIRALFHDYGHIGRTIRQEVELDKDISNEEFAALEAGKVLKQWLQDKGLEGGTDDKIIEYVQFGILGTSFGEVAFFTCISGHRISKLYLPPSGAAFECRRCQKFRYRLSNLNRNSVAGQAIHKFDAMRKIYDAKLNIRIFYRGKLTRRFNRWVARCGKVGLTAEFIVAKALVDMVESQ